MNINWRVRFKNKAFWIAIIPAILLLVVQVGNIFGLSLDFSVLQTQILAIVETVFGLLAILGIVVDPTTNDWSDSSRALTYTEPASNIKESAEE
jgi:phi LC3 family holin